MYSDQCGGQNRNIKMATLCNFIVANDKYSVNEIDHKFLVSGHLYLPCDQDFGLIEKEKKITKIYLYQMIGIVLYKMPGKKTISYYKYD